MFFVLTTPEEFGNATITGHFGFVFLGKNRAEEYHKYRNAIVFKKLGQFSNVFRPHQNAKPACSYSSCLKRVRLVRTVGKTGEIN